MLLPEKAIYWPQEQALIIADVHLGKVGHFRKAGIGIPRNMDQEDLAVMSDLIEKYKPKTLIFLGDLFHSDMNSDWEWLVLWRSLFDRINMVLVRGNHDILNERFYADLKFELCAQYFRGPFFFSHEPLKEKEIEGISHYVLCGHIHPAVTLKGGARQIITLPCFHFGSRQGVLPAFGKFTGRVSLRNSKGDRIYAVLKHKVVSVHDKTEGKI